MITMLDDNVDPQDVYTRVVTFGSLTPLCWAEMIVIHVEHKWLHFCTRAYELRVPTHLEYKVPPAHF
jgi:hypothetical protein